MWPIARSLADETPLSLGTTKDSVGDRAYSLFFPIVQYSTDDHDLNFSCFRFLRTDHVFDYDRHIRSMGKHQFIAIMAQV